MPKKKNGRITALIVLTVLLFAALVLRFAQWQIIESAEISAKASVSRKKTIAAEAPRGDITDRYGRVLAGSSTSYSLVILRGDFPAADDSEYRTEVVLKMYGILERSGEKICSDLPLCLDEAGEPRFLEGREDDAAVLKKFLSKQPYATARNCFDKLTSRYALEKASPQDAYRVMRIMYTLEQNGYYSYKQVTVATDLSISSITAVKEAGDELPGIYICAVPRRVYLYPEIAPHIIGYTGPIFAEEYEELSDKGYALDDIVGKSGIEKLAESYLRGTDGTSGSRGEPGSAPVAGATVSLTIDTALQQTAQESLAETVKTIARNGRGKENQGGDACAGACVVIKTDTSEVLAAANYPSYSLSDLLSDYNSVLYAEGKPLNNRAFQGLYPPGSTYKPLVAAAALESGTISPATHFMCNYYYTYYSDIDPGYRPHCTGTHGSVSLTRALAVSCNCFFYETGRLLGIDAIENYAARFGLGRKTGIGLAESAGTVAGPTERAARGGIWNPGDTLQASIGQSDNLFTPLQLANYTATICNGGTLYRPRIIKKVSSADLSETFVEDEPETAGETGVSQKNLEAVKRGMLSVTTEGTGAKVFASYGIKVGGKTGSAEVGGGSPNAVFVAFAPYDDPEIAVAVVIEHGWHGGDAANVAKAIFDEYFFPEGVETAVRPGGLNR